MKARGRSVASRDEKTIIEIYLLVYAVHGFIYSHTVIVEIKLSEK